LPERCRRLWVWPPFAYAFVRVASDGWSDIEAIVSFVAGGGVLPATFVIVEMLAAHR
jgi:hypothetical protein